MAKHRVKSTSRRDRRSMERLLKRRERSGLTYRELSESSGALCRL